MTAYTVHPDKSAEQHDDLRHSADNELDNGNLDINSGWVLPPETLGLLYKMASEPDNAADALKLLHELQTHQVELELQYRQLVTNEQFIKQQLDKFKSMLDVSAIGYLVADADGQILEINNAASKLLHIDTKAVIGTSVNQFFLPLAQARLRPLFKQLALHEDSAEIVCIETPQTGPADGKQLKMTASISVAGNAVLMTIVEHCSSQTN